MNQMVATGLLDRAGLHQRHRRRRPGAAEAALSRRLRRDPDGRADAAHGRLHGDPAHPRHTRPAPRLPIIAMTAPPSRASGSAAWPPAWTTTSPSRSTRPRWPRRWSGGCPRRRRTPTGSTWPGSTSCASSTTPARDSYVDRAIGNFLTTRRVDVATTVDGGRGRTDARRAARGRAPAGRRRPQPRRGRRSARRPGTSSSTRSTATLAGRRGGAAGPRGAARRGPRRRSAPTSASSSRCEPAD